MTKTKTLALAALIGAVLLFIVGVLMVAENAHQSVNAEIDPERRQGVGAALVLSLLGAAIATTTGLMLLMFPVGPASKIVFGVVCGPVLPLLLFAPEHIRDGRPPNDLGGPILLGMVIGLLAGIMEANRVIAARRAETDPAP